MPAGAFPGIGSQLQKKNDAGNFVTVAGVKAIDGPNPSRQFADTTVLNSPDNFTTFIPTLIETGQMKITAFYDGVEHAAMYADLIAGTPRIFKVLYVGSYGSLTVSGYVGSIGNEVVTTEAVQADLMIQCSGPLTFA